MHVLVINVDFVVNFCAKLISLCLCMQNTTLVSIDTHTQTFTYICWGLFGLFIYLFFFVEMIYWKCCELNCDGYGSALKHNIINYSSQSGVPHFFLIFFFVEKCFQSVHKSISKTP